MAESAKRVVRASRVSNYAPTLRSGSRLKRSTQGLAGV